jgi:hypothetical protein
MAVIVRDALRRVNRQVLSPTRQKAVRGDHELNITHNSPEVRQKAERLISPSKGYHARASTPSRSPPQTAMIAHRRRYRAAPSAREAPSRSSRANFEQWS